MNIKAGLVGLPNVGKSTLFNALTNAGIPAENYPFCTIDPHVAITKVPDERLINLKKIYNSGEIIPTYMEFVDIAGLVKGASKGEGLGNQFLSNIREVSLIIHVLRCFDDENIINTQQTVNPIRDYEIILFEFAQKDLESLQNRLQKMDTVIKKANNQTDMQNAKDEKNCIQEMIEIINSLDFKKAQFAAKNILLNHLNLLLAKPFLIVANISEKDVSSINTENETNSIEQIKTLKNYFKADNNEITIIPLCIALEFELENMNEDDKNLYKEEYKLESFGIEKIILASYKSLGLMSFFTCGPKEIHAWTIPINCTIKEAAGEIHSDLQKGFISAQVISYNDIFNYKSELGVKNEGKVKMVGGNYIMQDGDIITVNFNV